MLVEVIGQILGHAFGERGHQHALSALDADVDLGEQIVDLRLRRPHVEDRVDQPRRPHDLLDHLPRVLMLVVGGRR